MKKVIKKHRLTSIFLDTDRKKALCCLMKATKDKYASYSGNELKRLRLKRFAYDMWNSLQNEFYMSANISVSSFWKWQDRLDQFDEFGYLYYDVGHIEELSEWTILVKGWYNQDWALNVLTLIKDFNLDNQPTEYVTAFQNDFKKVINQQQFCSAMMKWSDLIFWSPWKLSLLDNTCPQPVSSHYEDEFNPDVEDSDACLD